MEQKRILFLMSRFLDGGIDTVLLEYLKWMARQPEYRITLAIATYMSNLEVFRNEIPDTVDVVYFTRAHWLTNLRRRRVSKTISPLGKIYDELVLNPIRQQLVRHRLGKLARRHDVIIDFDCCFYSALRKITVRKIAFFHFSFKHIAAEDPRRLSRLGRRLNDYDHIILIAEGMKAEAVSIFPHLAHKFTVLYNPKDPNDLEQRASEPVNDSRIHEPFILAVERLTTPKDIPTLLTAYQIFRNDYHHQEKLYIIGKGEEEEALRLLATQLGISNHVVFLGFIANPLPWIKACKMLVHSSKFEGLGVVMLEGLFLNKPVVATNCPIGPKEVLANGKAGILTPVGDAQALADAMHHLLTDSALRQSLLDYSRQHIKRFTFETIGHQLHKLMFPTPSTT